MTIIAQGFGFGGLGIGGWEDGVQALESICFSFCRPLLHLHELQRTVKSRRRSFYVGFRISGPEHSV